MKGRKKNGKNVEIKSIYSKLKLHLFIKFIYIYELNLLFNSYMLILFTPFLVYLIQPIIIPRCCHFNYSFIIKYSTKYSV